MGELRTPEVDVHTSVNLNEASFSTPDISESVFSISTSQISQVPQPR